MTPEQWKRARLVLEGARRHTPSDRSQYVSVACADDPELLKEVESLLNLGSTPTGQQEGDAAGPARTEWEHLTVLAEVGRGAFGRVYRAWDPALQHEVALKLISVATREPGFVDSVFHEARLLVKIRHPNVVVVHGARRVGSEVGIWMEFVNGPTLADVVERDGPLSPADAIAAGLAVCDALAAVHGAGLLHRDIKARNVMRDASGRVVLMDFGAGAERTRLPHGEMAGTPLYMAPELLKGGGASVASDIYSVGVLLFHLLTGEYPVPGSTIYELEAAHERNARIPLAERRPDLPAALVAVVERALSPDPNSRFRRAVEFKQALSEAASRAPETQPGAVPTRDNYPPWLLALQIGGVLVAVTFLGFLASAAFNLTLGRTSRFVNETALDWFVWGLRGLIAPAIYMAAMFYAAFLIRWLMLGCRTLLRRARGVKPVYRPRGRTVPANANTLVVVAGIAGIVAIIAILWRFSPLLRAISADINLAGAGDHAALAPDNQFERFFYRRSLELTMLFVGLMIYRARAQARAAGMSLDRGAAACAGGVLVIALLMTIVPYRIALQSEFVRAQFDGLRCYVLAQDARDVLVYCPESMVPHNRVVSSDDPRLRWEGIVENIFTPPDQAAPPQK